MKSGTVEAHGEDDGLAVQVVGLAVGVRRGFAGHQAGAQRLGHDVVAPGLEDCPQLVTRGVICGDADLIRNM